MRCMLCENLSFTHICSPCQKTFLTPSLYKRKISDNIEVISFYKYEDIKDLLHTKHKDIGYYIYSILAQNSFQKFAENFEYKEAVTSVAIDDNIQSGYSHTAILNRALASKCIRPTYNKLRANNSISYSGKSREFRLLHPRNFSLRGSITGSIILVDDIITTGTTLSQAISTIRADNTSTLFCLTLANASI